MARFRLRVALMLFALCAGGLGCDASRGRRARLNGGGSSFVYPVMSKWVHVYARQRRVEVNYQSIGSGGGVQQMIARTLDFGCSDVPLNDEQLEAVSAAGGEAVHVPHLMGPSFPLTICRAFRSLSGSRARYWPSCSSAGSNAGTIQGCSG